MSWPKEDMFAVTVDGKVLMNAKAVEGTDIRKLLGKKGVFVGVALTKREVKELLERFYDASSDAAAFFAGERRKRRRER